MLARLHSPGGRASYSASLTNGVLVASMAEPRPAHLFVADATRILDSLDAPSGGLWTTRLSRDGARAAFGGFSLWVYDLGRRMPTRLRPELAGEREAARIPVVHPQWSPGDSLLAFVRGAQARVLHLARGEVAALFDPPLGRELVLTDWSADGRALAVTLRPGGGVPRSELWSYSLADRRLSRMFDVAGDASGARFSPDGQWVAYESDESGTQEVYARPVSGVRAATRVSPSGGRSPRWSPDGRTLYFAADGGAAIMRVAVGHSGSFSVPTPAVRVRALEGPAGFVSFEVAPDGRRFVLFGRDDELSPPALTVVTNWPARVPPPR